MYSRCNVLAKYRFQWWDKVHQWLTGYKQTIFDQVIILFVLQQDETVLRFVGHIYGRPHPHLFTGSTLISSPHTLPDKLSHFLLRLERSVGGCRVSCMAWWNKWLFRIRHEKVRSEFVRNRVYNWPYIYWNSNTMSIQRICFHSLLTDN